MTAFMIIIGLSALIVGFLDWRIGRFFNNTKPVISALILSLLVMLSLAATSFFVFSWNIALVICFTAAVMFCIGVEVAILTAPIEAHTDLAILKRMKKWGPPDVAQRAKEELAKRESELDPLPWEPKQNGSYIARNLETNHTTMNDENDPRIFPNTPPTARDMHQHIEALERHIECNEDLIKRYNPQSEMVHKLKSQQAIWLEMLHAAREAQRGEEPWRVMKAKRLKRFRIPMGRYLHGWQLYFYLFSRPRWMAMRNLEVVWGKTNMELLELIDALNKEKDAKWLHPLDKINTQKK